MSEELLTSRAKKQISKRPHDIGGEVDLFLHQIDGLATALPLSTASLDSSCQVAQREFHKFTTDECKVVRDGNRLTITIEPGKYMRYRLLKGRVQETSLAQELVPRSLLVALVSQFDVFLGGLIRQLFEMKPEILNSSESMLTFAQLVEFDSIDDARESIVEKEIEGILRKSHSEQFDWLESKFGLPLRKELKIWPVFIEVTERRNLFVHTGGVISRQYIEVCRKHGVALEPDACQGKTLNVTPEYFESGLGCLFEIGVKLAQVLWRKVNPSEIEKADSNLMTCSPKFSPAKT